LQLRLKLRTYRNLCLREDRTTIMITAVIIDKISLQNVVIINILNVFDITFNDFGFSTITVYIIVILIILKYFTFSHELQTQK